MVIEYSVIHQKLNKESADEYVVANSKNYLRTKFTFQSDEWNGVKKTASFVSNFDNPVLQILDENDECLVPPECIKSGTLSVSVFGGDLITTNVCTVTIFESGYIEGVTPEPPTPDVYQQILNLLESLEAGTIPDDKIAEAVNKYLEENPVQSLTKEDVQKIVDEYIRVNKDELKGEKGDKGDPGVDGQDGYTPVKGTDYWTSDDIAEIHSYIDNQIGGALNGSY